MRNRVVMTCNPKVRSLRLKKICLRYENDNYDTTPCRKSFRIFLKKIAESQELDESNGGKEEDDKEKEDENTTETVRKTVKARR